MHKKLCLLLALIYTSFMFPQKSSFFQRETPAQISKVREIKKNLVNPKTYHLDIAGLKQLLNNAPKKSSASKSGGIVVSFPNPDGELESFRVFEASIMEPELQAKYPDIHSYAGQGIDDPAAVIRFSISPLGLQSMRLSPNKPAIFIEPYTSDLTQYSVYSKKDKISNYDDFECEVNQSLSNQMSGQDTYMRNADDGILRTYRLAISATGEYTQYHGGTKALAMAAINATMTRVNGVFENDFNVTMVLIANTDDVVYTNASTDPYSSSTSNYNSQLQSTLTSVIGNSNYDIGHLFANLQNNGNAGCIGCVCASGKGSGWTSHTTPVGDNFDIDYVAHEMGHQFGANHTWTFNGNEGSNAQMEPGSGSTIMGYAGITGATDVQAHSDAYFHAISIQQVTDYVKTTSCQTNTATGNSTPSVNAGSNYTIPKGTPFVLTGSASDADPGDVLSYCWEQFDENNASTTYPSTTATSGVAFRSYNPTTDNFRYFPRMSTIKTGATSWQWEAVPNVARTMNFRLTVRDNRAGGATNNSDDTVITVNGTAGPFVVNSPNTNVTWNAGTTQTVTWNVAGTTSNGVNAANVDIYLSTDGGDTYPIALAVGVPNDGSQDVVVPNNVGTQNRIMVKGSNHIFFDISNTNFTIAGQVVCNATVPTGLGASGLTDSAATLSWNAVPGASYDLQYREVGSSTWITVSVNGVSQALSGLSPLTQYEAQIRSKCPDNATSAYSGIITFTTTDVQLNYCSSAGTNVNDEYISRVQLNTINNPSGAQFYSDFTGISTTLTKGSQYTITVTPTWTGSVYSEGYSVWIDYNRDGDFDDSGEQVWTQAATSSTPVSGTFTVPASAVENSTTMRVSMKYNGVPTSCETFTYGEVEDYTVVIEGTGPDTTPPVITLNGSSTVTVTQGGAYTELGATAVDNVDGDISANIVIGGSVNTSVVGTYQVTYNVSDAAGNAAAQVIRTVEVVEPSSGCTGGISSFPYSESFENTLGAWTQSSADDMDWTVDANGTPSSNTGPSSAADGTYYVYVEASSPNYPSKRAILNSPCFDLNGVSGATFSFMYHMYGASDMGTIDLEVSEDEGATWSSIWSQSGNQGNSWQSASVSLDVYTGKGIQLRFNRFVGSTWQADVAIDDVSLTASGPDTTPPVITLNGASTINLWVGQSYTELGATATDNVDGNISANIVVGGDTVNTSVAGTYVVTYNVSDAAGNAAVEVTRTVIVTADTTPPVITLNGAATIDLLVGESYTELGATATDNVDGDITASIVIGGDTVNTSVAGTYVVTYNVSDAAGNAAAQVTRTVQVIADTTPPVITLNGSATINLIVGESYTELGATATDDIDGDLTSSIVIGGDTVNTSVVGTYVVTYNVSDASGNAAVEVTRTVNVAADTTAPSAPTNLSASGTTQTSTNLSWNASSDNVGVTGYDVYQDGSFITTVTGTSTTVNGLSPATSYSFFVKAKDAAGNVSSNSNTVNVTTLSNALTYCTSQGNITTDEYINRVQVGSINNLSGNNGGYADFTSISTNLNKGNNYSITITPAWTGTVYREAYRVWIDYNQDGDFNDSGEQVYSRSRTTASSVSGNFTVPTSALNGATRMRVSMKYNANPSSCETFTYGEVEDYTVIISSTAREDVIGSVESAVTQFSIYPNPVKGNELNIRIDAEASEVTIFNMLGQVVKKQAFSQTVDVSQLENGIYILEVTVGSERLTKRFIKE